MGRPKRKAAIKAQAQIKENLPSSGDDDEDADPTYTPSEKGKHFITTVIRNV
jgi:hypothetical protein